MKLFSMLEHRMKLIARRMMKLFSMLEHRMKLIAWEFDEAKLHALTPHETILHFKILHNKKKHEQNW